MNNTVGLALTEPKAPRSELKELGQEQLMPQAQRTLAQNVCNARRTCPDAGRAALLVVDDVLSLLSSANINVRSMHSDSELGYVAPNQELAQKWRRELWEAHVGGSDEDENGKCDAPKNFVRWNKMMDKNWRNKIYNIPLSCHLTRFWDVETPYAIAVD